MRIFEAAALAALAAATACAHGGSRDAITQQPQVTQQPQQATQQPQQPASPPPVQPPAATPPRPLAYRCADLLEGRTAPGEDVVVLRESCGALLRGAGAEGTPAGVATAPPPAGASARAAFTQAGSELLGRDGGRMGMGSLARGAVSNTLVTNPLGWFSGLGVNVTYLRPFPWDRASWLATARYSRTNAANGRVSAFGVGSGVDLFVFGRSNEGLRIGPRLDLAFGRETIQGSTDFARLGVSAELGYNFIASNGLSASVGGGYGGRLAGDAQDEDFWNYTGGEDGPYVKLGFGYSW